MTRYSVAIVVLAALAASSCKGGRAGVKLYNGVGVVVSIDRNAGTVEINHEDIEGFMTAMTMSFKARRTSLLDSIQPGDKVEFTLRDDGSGVVLVKVNKEN